MEDFYRIRRLPPYVFEKVNQAKAAARNAGADIIDMGMGNPDLPTPPHVIDKLKETLGKPRTDRYSASRGINGLRKAQAAYYGRRFGVKLNPETSRLGVASAVCRPTCSKRSTRPRLPRAMPGPTSSTWAWAIRTWRRRPM